MSLSVRFAFPALLIFLLPCLLYGAEADPFVREGKRFNVKKIFRRGGDHIRVLTRNGAELTESEVPVEDPVTPRLIPDFSGREGLLRSFEEYNALDFVEMFYEMEPFPPEADLLSILNRLSNIETLTGILYFSGRAQEMVQYIYSSYPVDAVNSYTKVEPPQFTSLPEAPVQFLFVQSDNRFSETWIQATLNVTSEGALHFRMTNVTPIYVQFIFYFEVLGAEQLLQDFIVLPGGTGGSASPRIYFSSHIHNSMTHVLGIPLNLGDSFDHRMSGVQGWISDQIQGIGTLNSERE